MADPPPSKIVETTPLQDFTYAADAFFTIVNAQMGTLESSEKLQLQLSAVPVDIADEYPYYTLGNLNRFFDVAVVPKPMSDTVVQLSSATRLSSIFRNFVLDAAKLVDRTDLTPQQVKDIAALDALIFRLSTEIAKNEGILSKMWKDHCEVNGFDETDLTRRTHWLLGQPLNTKNVDLQSEASIAAANLHKIRMDTYKSPAHFAIAEAAAAMISGGARMRWPAREDTFYPEKDRKQFSLTYLASLADVETGLFRNMYFATPRMSIERLKESTLGSFTGKITKETSESKEFSNTWSASASASFGPWLRVSARASGMENIKEDFSHVQTVTIGSAATIKLPIDWGSWFNPDLFKNPVVLEHPEIFAKYLGPNGTLRYHPTHLVLVRGLYIRFEANQNWQWDYEGEASGGGGISVLGLNFGGGGGGKHEKRQKIEKRNNDLWLQDGDDNFRLLGFTVYENPVMEELVPDRTRMPSDAVRADLERRMATAFPTRTPRKAP